MNHLYNPFRLFLLIICLMATLYTHAQKNTDSTSLKENIKKGVEDFKKKDSLFLETDFEQELETKIFLEVTKLEPTHFENRLKAKQAIAYYSSAAGVENLVRNFMMTAGNSGYKEIHSIENTLYLSVSLNSDTQDPMIGTDLRNKYATLVMQVIPERPDASVYLNGRRICLVNEAKNGIRVHSGEKYSVEIRIINNSYCKKEIILEHQEVKINTCLVNN